MVVPIICLFDIWRCEDVLFYKTYSLVVYWFILINFYAHAYPLAVNNSKKLAWVFACLRLNLFARGQYSISHRNCWLFPVTHMNFDACANFKFLERHHFIRTIPGTVSSTRDIMCSMITLPQNGLNLNSGYSTGLGAFSSISNSAGTVVSGTTWNLSWPHSTTQTTQTHSDKDSAYSHAVYCNNDECKSCEYRDKRRSLAELRKLYQEAKHQEMDNEEGNEGKIKLIWMDLVVRFIKKKKWTLQRNLLLQSWTIINSQHLDR